MCHERRLTKSDFTAPRTSPGSVPGTTVPSCDRATPNPRAAAPQVLYNQICSIAIAAALQCSLTRRHFFSSSSKRRCRRRRRRERRRRNLPISLIGGEACGGRGTPTVRPTHYPSILIRIKQAARGEPLPPPSLHRGFVDPYKTKSHSEPVCAPQGRRNGRGRGERGAGGRRSECNCNKGRRESGGGACYLV